MNMADSFRKSGKEMPVSAKRHVQPQPRAQEQRRPADAPASLPSNFVDEADRIMNGILHPTNGEKRVGITTSKIRNLLSLAIEIYHQEYLRTEPKLMEDSVYRIQMMRVRMAYEGGRDRDVKQFLEKSKLIPYLKDIGDDRMKLIRYTQYLEALVAYHCYYGGKEN